MSHKLCKYTSFLIILVLALTVGYAMYRLSGRNVYADFVRPALAVFAIGLASFLLIVAHHKLIAMLVLFITGLPVSCAILLAFAYYQSIGSVFTGDDVVAIEQSNLEEIWDFLSHYVLNLTSFLVTLTTTIMYVMLAFCQLKAFSLDRQTRAQIKKATSLYPEHPLEISHKARRLFLKGLKTQATLGAALMVMTALVLYTQFRPVAYYRLMVNDLQTKIETFNNLVKELESNPQSLATKDRKGELYVLVIGESLSRDSMGLYNKSVDNTPFLDKLARNGQTVVFPHAYSSFVNTVPSITASFSQGNLQTGLTFPRGNNLISLAKQAGIKTYWISNQVKNGNADTPIGAISTLADYSFFTTNYVFDGSYSQQPDLILLPTIRKTLDKLNPQENKLLIIHLMGNHSPYYNRYPNDFPDVKVSSPALIGGLSLEDDFNSNIGQSTYENYLTSIKYNDLVLQEITNLVKDRSDFQALVYYSDHGEALLYTSLSEKEQQKNSPMARHNVAQFSYAMTRIPLIISYSKTFAQRYPQTTQALEKNKEQVFTNDTLYDLMLDLMQVKSQDINYSLSVASSQYQRPKPSHIALVNNRFVGNDPDYLAYTNAHSRLGANVAIKSANALFKANLALSKGYHNLHINVILHEDQLYVKALSEFDSQFITLKDYISQLAGKPRLVIELDDSNLPQKLNDEIRAAGQTIGRALLELTPEQQANIFFATDNTPLLGVLEQYLFTNDKSSQAKTRAQNKAPAQAHKQPQALPKVTPKAEPEQDFASKQENLDIELTQYVAQNVAQNAAQEATQETTAVLSQNPEQKLANALADNQAQALSKAEQTELETGNKYFDQSKRVYMDGGKISIEQWHRLQIKNKKKCFNSKFNKTLDINLVWKINDVSHLTYLTEVSPVVHYIMVDESLLTTVSPTALCNKSMIVTAPKLIVQNQDFTYQMSWLKRRLPGTLVIVNYHNAFDSDFN